MNFVMQIDEQILLLFEGAAFRKVRAKDACIFCRAKETSAKLMGFHLETDTLMTTDGSCTLFMDFDTTVMYKVRCRGRSHHYCDIHNTEVWGDWSEEVLFHTGVGVPDTVLLDKRGCVTKACMVAILSSRGSVASGRRGSRFSMHRWVAAAGGVWRRHR